MTDGRTITIPALDYQRLAIILAATILGLAVNAAGLAATTGAQTVMEMLTTAVMCVPLVFIGAVTYDRHNPLRIPVVRGLVLFVVIGLANTLTFGMVVFRAGGQSNPVMSLALIGLIALFFTPGPFLAVWATHRYLLDPQHGSG